MFVPRTLRLKGVKEAEKRGPGKKPTSGAAQAPSSEDALIKAMEKTSTDSVAGSPMSIQEEETKPIVHKTSKPATASLPANYLAQLAAGVELIFTDYAHQEEDGAQWLQERYRSVDEEEKYIHLTALLDHSNINTLKPEATQLLLQKSLQEHPSKILELSQNGFYVRRRPSTYPAPFVPANSFEVVDDEGLPFWDQRTIYVEPHIRHMCKTPAKVAHWLTTHGQLKPKWLPVQAVHTLYNSCAFVVLSGNVMHEGPWEKWRAAEKPEDWKIMTKVEHTKRTEEYAALVKEAKLVEAGAKRQARHCLMENLAGGGEDNGGGQQDGKNKRKRSSTNTESARVGDGATAATEHPEAEGATTGLEQGNPHKRRARA